MDALMKYIFSIQLEIYFESNYRMLMTVDIPKIYIIRD